MPTKTPYYGNDLRFLKQANTAGARKVYDQLYNDYNRSFGVDVVYYRRGWTFYDKDKDERTADVIYGDDPTSKFYIKASLVIFMEVLADAYILNRFGIQNQSEMQMFIGINDFVETFRPLLGKQVGRPYSIPLKGKIGDPQLTGILNTPEVYGQVVVPLPDNYDASGKLVVPNLSFQSLPRPKDTDLYKAHSYACNGVGWNSFTATLLINFDTEVIAGVAAGAIIHNTNDSDLQQQDYDIRPQPGDFFRLDNVKLPDEYEITQVIDRAYAGTAYNPLLDKYNYICSVIRRTPSYEQVDIKHSIPGAPDSPFNPPAGIFGNPVQEVTEEPRTVTKDDQGDAIEKKSLEIYDYGDDRNDRAYGGYSE